MPGPWGPWATLSLSLSTSEVIQDPPPQLAVRAGAMKETTVRVLPDEVGGGQIGRGLEAPGGPKVDIKVAAGETGWDREACSVWRGRPAYGSVQAGRPGGGRQQIPLLRRAMRSSGN